MLPPGKQFICFKFIITRQVTQKGSILFLFISTLGIDVFLNGNWLSFGRRREQSLCIQCEYIPVASSSSVRAWIHHWALHHSAAWLGPHSSLETPLLFVCSLLREHCRPMVLVGFHEEVSVIALVSNFKMWECFGDSVWRKMTSTFSKSECLLFFFFWRMSWQYASNVIDYWMT